MARRSPTNPRYGKDSAPAGKTRKSAAAAKPKRSTAAPAKPAKKAVEKKPFVMHPPTPEYRRWQRIWWALLGSAVGITILSAVLTIWLEKKQIGNYALGLGYALIGIAMYIDFSKIRKLRNEYARTGATGSAEKQGAEKPDSSDNTTS